jgi:hypothetical protein
VRRFLGTLKPGAVKKIQVIDQERICRNRSCSPKTWHSGIFESVESSEVPKPRISELPLFVDLSPRSILNHTISDITILTQKSAKKYLSCGFETWSRGMCLKKALEQNSNLVSIKGAERVFFQEALTFNSDIRLGQYYSHWKFDPKENDLESFYFG